jgi:hypothetical protein
MPPSPHLLLLFRDALQELSRDSEENSSIIARLTRLADSFTSKAVLNRDKVKHSLRSILKFSLALNLLEDIQYSALENDQRLDSTLANYSELNEMSEFTGWSDLFSATKFLEEDLEALVQELQFKYFRNLKN